MKALALATLLLFLFSTAAAQDDVAVRAAVDRLLPDAGSVRIAESPLEGIRAVTVGSRVFFVSADGGYLLGGPLIDAATGANLSETLVADARRRTLDEAEDVPVFRYPATDAKYRVTVVTDIDCPYCRRLHNDLPAYAQAGIDVSYIMLPRAGKASASYRKTVSAACASSPEVAITAAMQGGEPETATCDNPIDEHMSLARELNVTSTPSIVLEDGQLVLGHKSADALLAVLRANSASKE
ncbi:MAG: DsbC family protein [Pseudomonadota bacterium]